MNIKAIVLFIGLIFMVSTQAKDIRVLKNISGTETIETPEFLVSHTQPFYGLAFIYNSVQPIYLVNNEVKFVDPEGQFKVPDAASHFGWKSRYQLALVENQEGLNAAYKINQLTLSAAGLTPLNTFVGYTNEFNQFKTLKYSHLWGWLRQVCLGLEWLLSNINLWLGNWGWSIVVLSLVMKLLLMPVSLLTLRFQRMVSKNQTLLAPRLQEIKQKYSGEKAHNEMMKAHKDLGITPFYALKPLFSNLIQIPILVAIFNVLGEMNQLEGQSFLWIHDLSLPDTLFHLGFAVPLFGSGFNLLPFLMTAITLFSTVLYKNELAPKSETKKQKINLYLMSFAFFVLFYPFPAAMVLYWAMANIWQFIQQKLLGN